MAPNNDKKSKKKSGTKKATETTVRIVAADHGPVSEVVIPALECHDVDVYYGTFRAVSEVNMSFGTNEITALIGPSGCGKSTFLRCLNRMNDTVDSARVTGQILLDGLDIYDRKVDVVQLRARVGMVF